MYQTIPSPHPSPHKERWQFSNRNKYVFINTNTLLVGAFRQWRDYPASFCLGVRVHPDLVLILPLAGEGRIHPEGHPKTTRIYYTFTLFSMRKAKKVIQKEGFSFCPKSKSDQTW